MALLIGVDAVVLRKRWVSSSDYKTPRVGGRFWKVCARTRGKAERGLGGRKRLGGGGKRLTEVYGGRRLSASCDVDALALHDDLGALHPAVPADGLEGVATVTVTVVSKRESAHHGRTTKLT